ncbi:protein CLT2 [Citrus sinensis]|nr:protein CLT2 [Citrus sinensis]
MEIISTSWFQAISSKPPLLKRRSHNFYGAKSRSLISMPVDGLPPCRSPTNKYNFARGITNILYSSRRNANFTARASTDGNPPKTASPSSSNSQIIIISSAVTVTLAIANRVLYKLALVPMKQYPFFLAQITTFGYVVIYFSILYTRYLMGIVTDEMISLPKYRFLFIAMLPGPAIPILSQTFLVWQLGFSAVLLGKKFSVTQIAGCLLVATGVGVAVASGSNSGQMLSRVDFLWPSMMIASSAFQAGASIIKEFIFDDAKKCLKGKSLDIFVVNSFGSGFQALFVLLFLPFLSNLKGIPFAELPLYLKSGAGCLLNLGANTSGKFLCLVASGCNGAPLLPLLYIATNMAFNISMLRLMKISSAVVSSLVVMLSVPIAIYVLSLPLPYLPEGASLSPFFLFGSVILLLGLTLYNLPQPAKRSSKMT